VITTRESVFLLVAEGYCMLSSYLGLAKITVYLIHFASDDNEFVKKTFFQVPLASASLTRSRVQTGVTLHPSPEQFQDSFAYIKSVHEAVGDHGMCCVVPPPEGWKVSNIKIIYTKHQVKNFGHS
jgi:jmjN domain